MEDERGREIQYFDILRWMLYKLLCRPDREILETDFSLRACLSFSMAEVIKSSSNDWKSRDESSLCWIGSRCLKQRFSSCSFQLEIPSRFASGAKISSVSLANLSRLEDGKASRVIMLWSRSASLMRTARASAMARNVVCSRSDSWALLAVLFSRASLLKWLNFET